MPTVNKNDEWHLVKSTKVSPLYFCVQRVELNESASFYNPFSLQVNLDAETREALLSVMDSLCADTFTMAQQRIYSLMAKDSFPRFLRSAHCMEAIKAF